MDRSEFQEQLVGLFLGLNGNFQTGYMPHSEFWENNGTDFYRVGILFPLHSQSERGKIFSAHLEIQKKAIDIVIAEVKNTELKLNDAIKSAGNSSNENINQLLRWCGLFEDNELPDLNNQFLSITDWGFEYADIVKYIKDRHRNVESSPTISDLNIAFNNK